ncbi:Protein CBR-TRX-3 [Caenorhabditis briggsae]|uniref:protein-disulfide reductase n=2 Tax=Caenorhabditis briggsae TaxID=6238 RepID=A0AAE9JG47_CAEBR|nr:Protein CBR-TRX-3 [Caenorhabditis briggsae]ULT96414.1 hypothetical protein L3Y34_004781 [Caenorhabditis briggsae]UMM29598.1 hypothetical protein L5515_011880 [Caenorhabditis briggsae]CAP22932.2 Protein CBR-TRX-3 [Caenorhabditis briggsae]
MSAENFFSGTSLRLKDGSMVDAGEHLKGKIVVLYFSASWCGPCRQFTPIMKELYQQIAATNQPIEVILLSRDYMRFQLDEYYEKQGCSWGVVPLRDPIIEKCLEKYDVKALPSCRVVDEFGNCLDANARHHVEMYREKRQMTELFNKWRQQMVQIRA